MLKRLTLMRLWGTWMAALLPLLTLAQATPPGPIGNEWIQPGQAYYKIKVAQRGMFRLSAAYLQAAGVPLAALDPHKLQLWRRGQEQSIFVQGEADNTFDQTDFIDFYGQPNDGLMDAELFKDPTQQFSQLTNIHTDTAAYFLTVGGQNGRRMTLSTTPSTGLTAMRSHLRDYRDIKPLYYYRGYDYGAIYLPWMDHAEGYSSNLTQPGGGTLSLTVDPALAPDTTQFQPELEICMVPVGFSPTNIEFRILKGTGATATVVRVAGSHLLAAFTHKTIRVPLRNRELLATNGQLSYRLAVTNNSPSNPYTFPTVAWARLRYMAKNALATRPQVVLTDSTLPAGPQYLLFDQAPAGAVGLDITNPTQIVRLPGQVTGTQWGMVVTTTGLTSRRVLVASGTTPLVPPAARAVRMRTFTPRPDAYLIVTNDKLLADSLGNHPVRDYAIYRASTTGGRYDTLVATVDQIYNVFHYGDRSPNAIRRYVHYMNSGAAPARYLFLIGKGYQPIQWGAGTIAVNYALFAKDLVPAVGYPASDVLYSCDFRAGSYEPVVPTGRLAAMTSADVAAYLAKVKQHELVGVEPWRKEILHLGGGRYGDEQNQFRSYLTAYADRATLRPYFGGHVSNVFRGNSGQNVTPVDITAAVNQGLALITFFGHSSTSVSDIDIGLASDPLRGYNNPGRYPFLLMNGCAAGNAFLDVKSFGEDWLETPVKGAIGFMAHTGDGIPTYLDYYTDSFYDAAFNDSTTFGKGLGDVQRNAIRKARNRVVPSDPVGMAQLTEMVLQADPAVKLYTPTLPDYVTADSMVSIRPFAGQRLTARADSFQIVVKVRNYARATRDSVRVQVKRTTGAGVISTTRQTFRPVFYGDTLALTIYTDSTQRQRVAGANTFDIFVDWPDSVREMSELNNQATIRYTFPAGSVFPLYPPEFAIVPNRTVTLTGQFDQPLTQPRPYVFELDTVPTFRSTGSARQTAVVSGRQYPFWQPTLPVRRDSLVWYWRFRPQNLAQGEDTAWATSSFRYISTSPGGWSQSHYGQFARDRKRGVRQATPSGKWSFVPFREHFNLRTLTGDSLNSVANFSVPTYGIFFNNDTRLRDNCGFTAGARQAARLILMVFDPKTLQPISLDSLYGTTSPTNPAGPMWCGQQGSNLNQVYVYRTGDLTRIPTGTVPQGDTSKYGDLRKIMRKVPDGAWVALISANRVPFNYMRGVRAILHNQLRSQLADSLKEGDPFVILAQKNTPGGAVYEKTWDRTRPRRSQPVVLEQDLFSLTNDAQIVSTTLGPAQQWREVFHTVKPLTTSAADTTSSYTLRVVPIDVQGQDGPAVPVTVRSNQRFNLSGVNAQQYPQVRLEIEKQDTINLQTPQLKQWLVTYDGVPEGVVRAELLRPWELNLSARLDSGRADVRLAVPFQNISPLAFRDSLLAEFNVVTAGGSLVIGPIRVKTGPLPADSLRRISVVVPVNRLASGDYKLQSTVNPTGATGSQPEQYNFNNSLEVPFKVVNPNMAPLVDVAFDGQHILHNDIVAPSPTITVSVRDEDHQRPVDPAQVKLFLTKPGQPLEVVPVVNNIKVQISPATGTRPLELTYKPGTLPNGLYTLQVQATDQAGNAAGPVPYETSFRVINETTISNFYPYPNPFSTNTRFLFTVTGKVPQNLKIQIMTVTGKVVREITKDELGTELRVGHNAGTNTWDGTDEYGDKLANGVYLYRVVVQDDADTFERYKTAADAKAFHKNWGKLYIMR